MTEIEENYIKLLEWLLLSLVARKGIIDTDTLRNELDTVDALCIDDYLALPIKNRLNRLESIIKRQDPNFNFTKIY